jgi:tetratricopeptide (TPR) repeat protein
LGRKFTWQRECFYLCIATLIIFLVSGCSTLNGLKDRYYARRHIERGVVELSLHNFDMAMSEHMSALALAGKSPPADEALFALALIYAHQDNPARDYERSLQYLNRIISEFPESRYAEDAKVVASLVSKMDRKKRAVGNSGKTRKKNKGKPFSSADRLFRAGKFEKAAAGYEKLLRGKGAVREEALFKMGLLFAHEDNPQKDYARSLNYFSDLTKEFPDGRYAVQAAVWKSVLNVIEEAKKVDIEIEKKKKELNR